MPRTLETGTRRFKWVSQGANLTLNASLVYQARELWSLAMLCKVISGECKQSLTASRPLIQAERISLGHHDRHRKDTRDIAAIYLVGRTSLSPLLFGANNGGRESGRGSEQVGSWRKITLLSAGEGLVQEGGTQELVEWLQETAWWDGMGQDSRHGDSCPGTKEICKEGIWCLAEEAVGNRPRKGEKGRAVYEQGYLGFQVAGGPDSLDHNHYFPISAKNVITLLQSLAFELRF